MKRGSIKAVEGDPKRDIPSILYKYRNWKDKHHSKIITNGEVYFTSPKECNDPFDCRITERFVGRTKAELKNYVNEIAIAHFKETERMGLNFETVFREFDRRVADVKSYQESTDIAHFRLQDQYYGVLSLSKNWDSILMWAHYSRNHTGFCVGIKGESLIASGDGRTKGGKMEYDKKYPDLRPQAIKNIPEMERIERAFIETHTKAKEWGYEKEYRVTKNFYGIDLDKIERRSYLPPGSIGEIILGILINAEDKEAILKAAKKKCIKVYQARKVPFKFKIDRELIL